MVRVIMYFYCWKKYLKHSKRRAENVRLIFSRDYKNLVPLDKRDKTIDYFDIDFRGLSFLVNPEDLWHDLFKYKALDIAIYLRLASIRSYPEYRVDGTLDLNRDFCNPKLLERLSSDIVYLDGHRLKFRYEETPQ